MRLQCRLHVPGPCPAPLSALYTSTLCNARRGRLPARFFTPQPSSDPHPGLHAARLHALWAGRVTAATSTAGVLPRLNWARSASAPLTIVELVALKAQPKNQEAQKVPVSGLPAEKK